MAEGWARHFANGQLEVQSAGITAHGKNPRAIAVMQEVGLDISHQQSTQLTQDMIDWADIIVTVCGHADEHCPALPATIEKIHWPLNDPAKAAGSDEAIQAVFRASRDDIRDRVQSLLQQLAQ